MFSARSTDLKSPQWKSPHWPLPRQIPSSLIKFLIVGTFNTFAGLATIFLLKWRLAMTDAAANAAGYLVGLTISFSLNRHWTFRGSTSALPAAALRFVAVFVAAYLINLGTVLTLTGAAGVNGYLAQAAGVLPYTTVFYLGSRYIAFR